MLATNVMKTNVRVRRRQRGGGGAERGRERGVKKEGKVGRDWKSTLSTTAVKNKNLPSMPSFESGIEGERVHNNLVCIIIIGKRSKSPLANWAGEDNEN